MSLSMISLLPVFMAFCLRNYFIKSIVIFVLKG